MTTADDRIAALRAFNRFYTQRIGVLGEGLHDSPFTLTEVRVLYEIAHHDRPTASDIVATLGLDAGYLSRLLARLARLGLIERKPSGHDARRRELSLTRKGRKAFDGLVESSNRQAGALIGALDEDSQRRLVEALTVVRKGLGGHAFDEPVVLREPGPGDLGWVVERHGALYTREYGYSGRFEALVARIAADFLDTRDPACERGWIAERGGTRLGCVFLVKKSRTAAKLRMLLVEPSARGLGIGKRLVDACIDFAREAGYRQMVLWTHGHLASARAIYERAGFRLVDERPDDTFGPGVVEQNWQLAL